MLGSARMRTPLLGTAKVLAVLRNTDRGVLVAGCRMIPLDSENVLWVGDAGLAAWHIVSTMPRSCPFQDKPAVSTV